MARNKEHRSDQQVVLQPIDTLVLSVWFGVMTGFAEVAVLAFRKFYQDRMIFVPAEVLWMAPSSNAALFAVCGAALALGAWWLPRRVTLRFTCFVMVSLVTLCIVSYFEWIAIWARVLLSLGIGTQLSRTLATRPGILQKAIRVSTGWLAFSRRRIGPGKEATNTASSASPLVSRREVVVGSAVGLAGLAAGMYAWRRISEKRALASLPAARRTPNVLLLVLDTVRARNLSLHGYKRNTTPKLVDFAERNLCFNQAFAPSSWTLPSHATFFTGQYLHDTKSNIADPLGQTFPTLAEVLSGHGYETAGFSANPWFVTREYAMDRGFARFHDHHLASSGKVLSSSMAGRSLLSHAFSRRLLLGRDDFPGRKSAAMNNRHLLNWLSTRDRSRPFFAFVNYYDAHGPYIPPPRFARHFSDRVPDDPWFEAVFKTKVGVDFPEVLALRDAYDRCIAGLDDAVGNLLSELDRSGELDETVVIVTSDHGEHLGEHGLTDHGNSLYLPLLHVPLVVSLPGRQKPMARVDEPVSLRDLPATVMDLLRLEHQFPGSSWRLAWETSHEPPDVKVPLLFEVERWGRHSSWSPVSKGPMKALIDGEFHYIRNGDDSEELYNYTADLAEEDNLAQAAEHAHRIERFRSLLPDA